MKLVVALLLLLFASTCPAKQVADALLEFSIVLPDETKVEAAQNEKGRVVTAVYKNEDTLEAFTVQAVRMNNGGTFKKPLAIVFKELIDGTSGTLGKPPSSPLRTLRYGDFQLYVAQHRGIGANRAQTLSTIVFFQERDSWRKMIVIQLITNGFSPPTDEELLHRLDKAGFRPVA